MCDAKVLVSIAVNFQHEQAVKERRHLKLSLIPEGTESK